MGDLLKGLDQSTAEAVETTRINNMKVTYKQFRGVLATWDDLFTQASDFATSLGRDSLINISHSASGADGIVTVWYWE